MVEEQIEGLNNFNETQKVYLNVLKEYTYGDVSISNIVSLLSLDKYELKAEAERQIQRINELKIDRNKSSKKVRKAWQVLENFVDSKSSTIKENELIPIAYGSIVFDDVRHLDYDLLLASRNEKPNMSGFLKTWDEELNDEWSGVGEEGHTAYFSIDRLRNRCRAFQEELTEYVDRYAEDIDDDFVHATIIMMGEVISSNDSDKEKESKKLHEIREQIWDLAQETPELMAAIAFNLQQTVVERETRRLGLAPHQTGGQNK